MSLRRVSVRVPAQDGELARAAFLELAPDGFEEVEDGAELELALYTDGAGEAAIRKRFGAVATAAVAEDWAERWREFHRSVTIGGLWVGPPWEEAAPGFLPVVIEPAQAFGTGAHPTTRLTLELLQDLPRGSVLDVGCGSGVLSVAAAKLGFGPIVAVDFDPIAVETAAENAARNGVAFETRVADALVDDLPGTDIVLANVSEIVLEALAPRLVAPMLVASGFYVDGEPPLRGYREVDRRVDDRWLAVAARRISPAAG